MHTVSVILVSAKVEVARALEHNLPHRSFNEVEVCEPNNAFFDTLGYLDIFHLTGF
jgi:hypothetical protein